MSDDSKNYLELTFYFENNVDDDNKELIKRIRRTLINLTT